MNRVLITGGTGSLGKALAWRLLRDKLAGQIVIFSRDELKQSQMQHAIKIHFPEQYPPVRFVLGDVRDRESLAAAMGGIDTVIHAAAMKQVPACEAHPWEAIQTNVIGTRNALLAADRGGAKKFIFVSSDKACEPINVYGKTKAVAESLVTNFDSYGTFSVVRYGNVFGSRGSVYELWSHENEMKDSLSITDPSMTRFFFSIQDAVRFILGVHDIMRGRDIFVPRLGSVCMPVLAEVLFPIASQKVVGIRPGEKLHEKLVATSESGRCVKKTIPMMEQFMVVRRSEENGTPTERLSSPEGYSSRDEDCLLTVRALVKQHCERMLSTGKETL